MSLTGGVADDFQIELLVAVVPCDAARHDICRGIRAVEADGIGAVGILHAVGHQAFADNQLRTLFQLGDGCAGSIVNALDLHHFHLAAAVVLHVDLGDGVQDPLTGAVAGAVMLLGIADTGVFADIKAMDTVVLGIMRAAVIDTAARDDLNIGVVADEKVVIDLFLQPAFCHHDGNMNGLVFGIRLDKDIDATDPLFGDNIDIRGGLSADRLTVRADIVCACRNIRDIGDLFE